MKLHEHGLHWRICLRPTGVLVAGARRSCASGVARARKFAAAGSSGSVLLGPGLFRGWRVACRSPGAVGLHEACQCWHCQSRRGAYGALGGVGRTAGACRRTCFSSSHDDRAQQLRRAPSAGLGGAHHSCDAGEEQACPRRQVLAGSCSPAPKRASLCSCTFAGTV